MSARPLVTDEIRAEAAAWLPAEGIDDRLARVAWSVLAEPGDGVAGALIASEGAAGALRVAGERGSVPREVADGRARWGARWDPALVAHAVSRGARRGMTFLAPGDAHWPTGFADLGPHAPLALWVRGDARALATDASVALVGARAATPYGELVATEMASDLARAGVTVVSGAAYGIDGAAHRAALRSGAPTIAFVAGGADRVYPAGHAHLLAQIVGQGAVAAECPPGTTPTRWRFLARNRLIAALSGATVVIEAVARSGTINTAGHAASLGRPLGAVPGPVTSATSAGCHLLLREYGAQCVTGAADARELIGLGDVLSALAYESAESTRVADALSRGRARTVDELARRSGMAPGEVTAVLGLLQLEGRAAERAEGWVSTA